MVDNKLTMSHQWILTAMRVHSTRMSAASRLREVILPLCSSLERPHQECWVQFWVPSTRRTWTYRKQSIEGQWKWLRVSLLWICLERLVRQNILTGSKGIVWNAGQQINKNPKKYKDIFSIIFDTTVLDAGGITETRLQKCNHLVSWHCHNQRQ